MDGFNVIDEIAKSLQNMFSRIGDILPTLISALIILILGWLIAKVIKWLLLKLLRAINVDTLADKVGVNDYLVKGGVKKKTSGLLATLGYWIVMFTMLTMFFNTLGLDVVSNLLTDVVHYLPNIIVACLLLIVGMYLAEFVSSLVVAALKGGDFDSPHVVGKIAYTAVLFFTVALVLDQLNIGGDIIRNVVTVIMSGAGLAFAIAFGLGGKDWAASLLNKYLRK